MAEDKVYFHVDLDAFFASVEMLDDPSLEGKPVIIGGKGPRSVASTCNYEARKYGVHSAMPMVRALQLCPSAIVISGNYSRYLEKSREVMNIFNSFSSNIRQISVDEAFLDMSGTTTIFGHPFKAGLTLKKKVKDISGLSISVGIGPSKLIAKMASDFNKPDGICIVEKGREIEFVDAVGLKGLWGVGKVTQKKLEQKHIKTNEQLRSFTVKSLTSMFGESMGYYLYNICRGIDVGIFEGETKSHSISTERTFIEDIGSIDVLYTNLLDMCYEILYRSLSENKMARTIGIKIRYSDFSTFSSQMTPDIPIYNAEQIYEYAKTLLNKKWTKSPVRLLGVGLYQTYNKDTMVQTYLFDEENKKKRDLEKISLALKNKGLNITKATLLKKKEPKNANSHSTDPSGETY
ncbi:MAG: DNA polymerase IV [Spirochaetaceae bacterium]|nr:DNA polymerase IV [Spirochaetaceae bacterium]